MTNRRYAPVIYFVIAVFLAVISFFMVMGRSPDTRLVDLLQIFSVGVLLGTTTIGAFRVLFARNRAA